VRSITAEIEGKLLGNSKPFPAIAQLIEFFGGSRQRNNSTGAETNRMMTCNVSKCRYSGLYAIADLVRHTKARRAAAVPSAEEERSPDTG
jgi:hypothetical protein